MKIMAVWKPWLYFSSPEDVVFAAMALGCDEICLKAADGTIEYGINAEVKARWGGGTIRDLEPAAKAQGIEISIWVIPYFWEPEKEAALIRRLALFYNAAVYLDVELFRKRGFFRGTKIKVENGVEYIANVGPFIRLLGRLPKPVYLQSVRRPYRLDGSPARWVPYHPEIQIEKWLSYRDPLAGGAYIVDGISPQLYPMGWKGEKNFREQTILDIDSNLEVLRRLGRSEIVWIPTLPAFEEHAWSPTPAELAAEISALREKLGSRLVGLHFWTLDFSKKLPDLFASIAGIPDPAGPPPPPPESLRAWATRAGVYREKVLSLFDRMPIDVVVEIRANDPGPPPAE